MTTTNLLDLPLAFTQYTDSHHTKLLASKQREHLAREISNGGGHQKNAIQNKQN